MRFADKGEVIVLKSAQSLLHATTDIVPVVIVSVQYVITNRQGVAKTLPGNARLCVGCGLRVHATRFIFFSWPAPVYCCGELHQNFILLCV